MEKLKAIKDLKVTVSDRLPVVGDTIINVNKKSINYGLMSSVHIPWIDVKNWKVLVDVEKENNAKFAL